VSVKFTKKTVEEFEALASHYAQRRAALLPALYLAQRDFGYLSLEALEATAELVGCTPAQALEVAEFYTMYKKKPSGKHHLQVCRTLSCMLNGAEEVQRVVERKLGLKNGETTPDGLFSYQQVECLAACHAGPCLMVNDESYERMSPQKTEDLIDQLKKSN
jgi:NADH-quinone oxidoreductase subunit E